MKDVKCYSAALTGDFHLAALSHLIRADGQEDLCFATWHPSNGRNRKTALLDRLILPEAGDRHVHGNASFEARYFERAVMEAVRSGGGLAFLHSHPGPGWQDMSPDDIAAEHGHAAAVKGATGLPFVGLTAGTDGSWSARFWEKTAPSTYHRRWCSTVRVAGPQLSITFNDRLFPPPASSDALRRTISSWGHAKQADLARIHVGVVGAGSVGSIVAEALARTGIAHITLIDFDNSETTKNRLMDHAHFLLHSDAAVQEAIYGEFFDYIADNYESMIDQRRNLANVANLLRELSRLLGGLQGKTIMDFGCGTGIAIPQLLQAGADFVGVDRSPHMREIASHRGMRVLSLEGLCSRDLIFDGAIASYVLHLVSTDQVVEKLVKTLRPGAVLVGNYHKDRNALWANEAFERHGCSVIRLPSEGGQNHGSYFAYAKR